MTMNIEYLWFNNFEALQRGWRVSIEDIGEDEIVVERGLDLFGTILI